MKSQPKQVPISVIDNTFLADLGEVAQRKMV